VVFVCFSVTNGKAVSSMVAVADGVTGITVSGVRTKSELPSCGGDCATCQPEPGGFAAITDELVAENITPAIKNRIPPANRMRISILK
jgi:hypothetical protein